MNTGVKEKGENCQQELPESCFFHHKYFIFSNILPLSQLCDFLFFCSRTKQCKVINTIESNFQLLKSV